VVPAHIPRSCERDSTRLIEVNIKECAKQQFVPCSLLFLAGSCNSVTCHYCDAGRHDFRDGQPNESLRHHARYSVFFRSVKVSDCEALQFMQKWENLCTVTCTTAAVGDQKCSALRAYQSILSGQVAAAQEDSSCHCESDRWPIVLQ